MVEGRQVVTVLDPKQHASLVRAVARRSRGAISLPRVELKRGEAIRLWQDLVLAFGPPLGRDLTPFELIKLRRRAWARSAGHASLGAETISLGSSLAFWRLAVRLGMLAEHRAQSGLARAASIAVVGLAATQLAACTSLFGGNIKGSFACSAPGGTCAPSTLIDDQALSVIQNARPMTPAGPFIRQPAAAKPVTTAYTPAGSGRLVPSGNGMVHRERRVLKVVFPSFVDGGGNLHEPRIVHAVVDDGAWMQLSSGEPNLGEQVEGRAVSLASAALTPVPGVPAPMADASAASLVDHGAAPADPAPAALPTPEAIAAARAKAAALKSGNAVDVIRAEVQARLAHTAKAPIPSAAKSTGSARSGAIAPPAAAPSAAAGEVTPANAPAAFPAKVEE